MLQPLVEFFRQILKSFHSYRSYWVVDTSTKITIVLTLLSIALILWRWSLLPPDVPLWFVRAWGEDRLAPQIFLFLLPAGNVVWLCVTLLMTKYISKEYSFFIQLLYVSVAFISVLACITLIKILFLVT